MTMKFILLVLATAAVVGCGNKEDGDPALDTAAPKTTSATPNVPAPISDKPALRPLPPPAGGTPPAARD